MSQLVRPVTSPDQSGFDPGEEVLDHAEALRVPIVTCGLPAWRYGACPKAAGLDLFERPADAAEVGDSARAVAGVVIAVMRGGEVLTSDDPRVARIEEGDQLILVRSRDRRASQP